MSIEDCKKVTITFHSAEELPKADLIGKIDPYAACVAAAVLSEVPVRLAQSQVVKKDYSPEWNETHTFNASSKAPLKLQIYDWDMVSKDDCVAEVEVPFEECDKQEFEMAVLIKNKKKKEPKIVVSIKIEDCDPVGVFALIPALEEAGLETEVVKEASGAVEIVANLHSLVHTDVFMAFHFAPSGADVGVKVLRATSERTALARLCRGEQPVDGELHSFTAATKVAGKDVFEYFVPAQKMTIESDWSQLSVLMEEIKVKKQESHKEIAERHGWTPAGPEETPEDLAARLEAIEKAVIQGNTIYYQWHHNKEEPNPLKALAGFNGGVAVTKIVSDKSHKYLGDVTVSGKASHRTITMHANPDTSVGGVTVGATTTAKANVDSSQIVHSLYRLHTFESAEGEKVRPVPLASFAKFN